MTTTIFYALLAAALWSDHLCTAAAFPNLFGLNNFKRYPSPPKVIGFDFKRSVPRNTPKINALQRRQKTVTATLTDDQIT